MDFNDIKEGQFLDVAICDTGYIQVEVVEVNNNLMKCNVILLYSTCYSCQSFCKSVLDEVITFTKDEIASIRVNEINDSLIEEVWNEFENIPTDKNNEVIEESFAYWEKGTYVSDILRWFNKRHSKGLIEGVINRED